MSRKKYLMVKFGWTLNEAKAYETLADEGCMEAKELSVKGGIHESKIYSVLSRLEKRGVVRKLHGRPAFYEAQHPKYVMEQEMAALREETDLWVQGLESKWEQRSEKTFNAREKTWCVRGVDGIASEVRRWLELCKRKVRIAHDDLSWLRSRDLRRFEEKTNNGVDIRVVSNDQTILERLSHNGVKVKFVPTLRESFYIFSNELCMLVLRGEKGTGTGLLIRDIEHTKLLRKHFNSLYKRAVPLSSDKNVA